jgi:hypothetical protein
MPQVPYQPFSTAEPSGGGEHLTVSTPPAAFGENVAQAVQGLGGQLEKSGDELFTRAMALQDLRNETDAREAQTQYAQKASELHAQYGALEGKAAADGLQGYIKAQADLRTQFRDGLKTQFAQRYYDRDTLPFMQRNIFSAAGHAADQNKASVIGTAVAQKDIVARTFVDPKSDDEFNDKLAHTYSADETIAAAKGFTSEQLSDLKLKSVSGLWLGRIGQLAHDDPQTALKMLDEHKESMTQDDYGKAVTVTRAQNRAIGGANLVNDVYSPDKTAAQMEAEIKDRSADLAHGDPLFEKDALTGLKGKITTDRYIKNQDTNTAKQSIFDTIQKGVMDIRELRLQPGMAQAIDSLPASEREKLPGQINAYNAARDKQGHEENYTALTGMYYNDREAFLDTDFTKYNLSQSQIRDLMAKRAQAIAIPADDPMLNRAMGWLRQGRAAELRALGIYFRPTSGADATDYDHYTGALQAGIDAWRQEHGKPPGYKDIVDTIGPSVIHERTEPGTFGMLFGGVKRPAFQQDMSVVKEWADKKGLVDEIKARGGADPTDEELYRAYLRSQFIDLYSKPKDASGGGPSVPQSK